MKKSIILILTLFYLLLCPMAGAKEKGSVPNSMTEFLSATCQANFENMKKASAFIEARIKDEKKFTKKEEAILLTYRSFIENSKHFNSILIETVNYHNLMSSIERDREAVYKIHFAFFLDKVAKEGCIFILSRLNRQIKTLNQASLHEYTQPITETAQLVTEYVDFFTPLIETTASLHKNSNTFQLGGTTFEHNIPAGYEVSSQLATSEYKESYGEAAGGGEEVLVVMQSTTTIPAHTLAIIVDKTLSYFKTTQEQFDYFKQACVLHLELQPKESISVGGLSFDAINRPVIIKDTPNSFSYAGVSKVSHPFGTGYLLGVHSYCLINSQIVHVAQSYSLSTNEDIQIYLNTYEKTLSALDLRGGGTLGAHGKK